jgi:hypothetical protein
MTSVKEDIINEIMKPARIKYPRRHTVLKGENDLWQIDLIEMIPMARFNKGLRYIVVAINCLTKYVWTAPIKNKSGKEVTKAVEKNFTVNYTS